MEDYLGGNECTAYTFKWRTSNSEVIRRSISLGAVLLISEISNGGGWGGGRAGLYPVSKQIGLPRRCIEESLHEFILLNDSVL